MDRLAKHVIITIDARLENWYNEVICMELPEYWKKPETPVGQARSV
jgi:hypothetical protein